MRIIKIVISALLFMAVLDLPYGYYQFLGITVFIGTVYFIYSEFKLPTKWQLAIYAVIAILFNPILPIYLTKETWLYLDIISGILLLVTIPIRKII